MSLPVYSRASLSRTAATVVALFLTATASAVAREFRAADTQSEDYPTIQAPRYMGRMIAERSGGRHEIRIFHSRELGEVLATPFPFRSIEYLQKVLDGSVGNEILDSFEPYGFVGLRDLAAAQLIERIRKVE